MHISEGILSVPILVGGGLLTGGGVCMGLRSMRDEDIPRVALLSSAFFIASLVHIPVGVATVHLTLNGLAGIILGWAAFPAILVALFLQAILFEVGGLTTLGVNTTSMALPAIACHLIFRGLFSSQRRHRAAVLGFVAGALGIALGVAMTTSALLASGKGLATVAGLFALSHAGLVIVEGIITAGIVAFLAQVRPDIILRRRKERPS